MFPMPTWLHAMPHQASATGAEGPATWALALGAVLRGAVWLMASGPPCQ